MFPDNFVKLLPSDFEKEVSNVFFQFHCRMKKGTGIEILFQVCDLDKFYLQTNNKNKILKETNF